MSACVELLCNGWHNGWCWAICITLCNHRFEMYLSHLKLYGCYEQYGKCSYIISGF